MKVDELVEQINIEIDKKLEKGYLLDYTYEVNYLARNGDIDGLKKILREVSQ